MKLETTPEFKVKKETKKEESNSSSVGGFISFLMSSRTIVHILHLNREGVGSYASHKALDDYYSGIVDLIDSIAECWQGYSGELIKGYKDFPISIYENSDPLSYLKLVKTYVQLHRYEIFPKEYSPIQNEIDNVENLLNKTLYKLQFLK